MQIVKMNSDTRGMDNDSNIVISSAGVRKQEGSISTLLDERHHVIDSAMFWVWFCLRFIQLSS